MRFIRYDGTKLGLLTDAGGVDLTSRLDLRTDDPLLEYLRSGRDAAAFADEPADFDPASVDLEAPVRRPGKIVCAPGNYYEHQVEMIDTYDEVEGEKSYDGVEWTIRDKGYFLKAPSSVIGPGDTIEIPFNDRRVDHEVELAMVVGEAVKDVTAEAALDAVLGYTILLDISLRGDQDRSNRKSYDTFTVIGPCVATPEEVADPQDLDLELAVNGEVRQDATTADMIYTCAEFLQYASIGTTLEAGDVVTTGTPPGVGQLHDGDRIEARVEGIGGMDVDVRVLDRTFDEVDVKA